MSHTTSLFLLPVAFAASAAIFAGFGKRKAAPAPKPEELEPLPTDLETEPTPAPVDDDGRTLPVLGLFGQGEEADQETCERIWNALSVPLRNHQEDATAATRFFGLTSFNPTSEGQDAVVQTAVKMAVTAVDRGYSVLLMDAHVHRPTLHTLEIFQDASGHVGVPSGFAEFLRGETSKLSALIKMASGKEGLLLLPAGRVTPNESVLSGGATLDRLLRLTSPFAEVVLLVVPPLMEPAQSIDNAHLLPKMTGVLVAYPSGFSASGDTEALEKLEAMDVAEVGAIITPPASFADAPILPDSPPQAHEIASVEVVSVEEMETMVSTDPIVAVEPDAEPESVAEPDTDIEAVSEETETPEFTDEPVASTETVVPVEAPVEEIVEAAPVPEEIPESPIPTTTESPRPSFMATATPPTMERIRGNNRRAVPVENIPADTIAPVRQNRPAMNIPPTNPAPVEQSLAVVALYRPEVSLELLPASDASGFVTLRAEVGGMGNNPALLLEVRTLSAESKRLRADNPGTNGGTDAPILTLESLVADTAPEEATVLRLHARESNAPDAATLLEAILEKPDDLRIRSGKATAPGVPPVRFEVMSEPDGTSRFRATVPPLGETPALYIDLERAVTKEGRWSRVIIRLA